MNMDICFGPNLERKGQWQESKRWILKESSYVNV